jgi:hypothetical protein
MAVLALVLLSLLCHVLADSAGLDSLTRADEEAYCFASTEADSSRQWLQPSSTL